MLASLMLMLLVNSLYSTMQILQLGILADFEHLFYHIAKYNIWLCGVLQNCLSRILANWALVPMSSTVLHEKLLAHFPSFWLWHRHDSTMQNMGSSFGALESCELYAGFYPRDNIFLLH